MPDPKPNPLLSVDEVGVELGVTPNVVAYYVANGELVSVDEGSLVGRGRNDIPLIRLSEVERLQAAWARLSAEKGQAEVVYPKSPEEHPGLMAATVFLYAVQEKNASEAFELSSEASKKHFGTAEKLLQWWRRYLGGPGLAKMGIASGVYTLRRHNALAVRYVSEAVPGGFVVRHTTVIPEAMPIALVHEADGWKVDYPLQERRGEWEQEAGTLSPDHSPR